ncbi:MAG: hypothetical protein WCJ31_21420 [Planctomycetia bacterium]
MTLGMNSTLRSARMTAVLTDLDKNASAGKIEFYSGTRPATGAGIGAAVLLGTCTLSKPCGTVTTGVLTFSAITNGTGTAGADGGTVSTWCRFTDGAGVFVLDGSVGTSGADVNLNSTTIATGQTITVTGGTLTEGNA